LVERSTNRASRVVGRPGTLMSMDPEEPVTDLAGL